MITLANTYVVDFKGNKARKGTLFISDGIITDIRYNMTKPTGDFKRIDLKGTYTIPGFIDSHTHLLGHGIELQRVGLNNCHSPEDCLEKLRSNLDESAENLFGVNWDESNWTSGKKQDIDKKALDGISKKIPVIMRRVCGHFAIGNTKALSCISNNWRIVDRHKGYLYEDAALYLNEIFRPSENMLTKGLELAMDEALSLGITSIHEIITIPRGFEIYQKLKKKLKVSVYLRIKHIDEVISTGITSGFGDENLKFSGLKLFLDGSIGAMTAALTKYYPNTRNKGKLLVTKKDLVGIVRKAEKNGLQLMTHSIGDRATGLLLEAYDDIGLKENRLRHRIEHLEIAGEHLMKKIAGKNLLVSMQPNFVRQWQKPGGMYEKYLGSGYRSMNSFRKAANAGIRLMFGSDGMPMGPLYGIAGAVNHPSASEKLSPAQAFYYYTAGGAYGTFDDNIKGEIGVGMLADLVVLNENPLQKENLETLKVLMVFMGGKLTYEKHEPK